MWPLLLIFATNAVVHALVLCFIPATHWPHTGLALLAEHSFFLPAGLVASLQPSIGPASAGDLTGSPDPS